ASILPRGSGVHLADHSRNLLFDRATDSRSARLSFLEHLRRQRALALPTESRMDSVRARALGSDSPFFALICPLASRLGMDSEKLSFVSAKCLAPELLSVSSFG